MRLTLRTLLSWKDGMLDAEAAGDFAARVAASDPARRLAERIDEVTARPTLTAAAPDAAGFAVDANTTAEYLDNALEPGQLAEFERACFQSDALLAETAATHTLLASWWREPASDLPPAARRRLLAAVRARGGDPRPAAAPPPRIAAAPVRTAAPPRRAPASAWLLVASAMLLLGALVGVLGWSLTRNPQRPGDRRDVAARASDDGAAAAPPAANAFAEPADGRRPDAPAAPAGRAADVPAGEATPTAPAGPAPVAPADAVAADMPATIAANGAAVAPPAEPAAIVPPGAAVGDAPPPAPSAVGPAAAAPPAVAAPPAAVRADRRVPQGDALAIAAPAAPQPGEAPAPAPANAAVPGRAPAGAAAGAARIEGSAVLLHRPSADAAAAWLAGAAGATLDLPVELVAPPFGAPTLDVGGTRIALEPGTRAALGRDADGVHRLEIVFGAATVAVGGRLGITAGELAGVVVTGPAVPVGVEVNLDRGPGDAAESVRRVARIVPASGPAEWRQTAVDGGPRGRLLDGIDAVVTVPAGRALAWRSERPECAAIEAAGPLPAWLVGRRANDPVDGRAAQALARSLAAGTAAIPALRELAADRRVESRVAAAATLALVGEFDALARLLSADGGDALPAGWWERLDAVAVQRALARGPKAAEALARALAERAPPGAADTVVRFARGFTDEELAAGADADLVAGLGSPHLVVRRFAIKNLVAITGASRAEQLRYRADWSDEAARAKGAAWWRVQLDQGRIRRGAAAAGAGR